MPPARRRPSRAPRRRTARGRRPGRRRSRRRRRRHTGRGRGGRAPVPSSSSWSGASTSTRSASCSVATRARSAPGHERGERRSTALDAALRAALARSVRSDVLTPESSPASGTVRTSTSSRGGRSASDAPRRASGSSEPADSSATTIDRTGPAPCVSAGARGALERCVLAENGPLELLERRPGLEAELVGEMRAGLPVGLERLGLAAAPVEGDHVEPPRPFAQRVRAGEVARLGRDLGVPAARELGLEPALERQDAQLLQARRDRRHRRLVDEIRERRAAPERERLTKGSGRVLEALLRERQAPGVRRAARTGSGPARRFGPAPGSPFHSSRSRPGREPCGAARRSSGGR